MIHRSCNAPLGNYPERHRRRRAITVTVLIVVSSCMSNNVALGRLVSPANPAALTGDGFLRACEGAVIQMLELEDRLERHVG
jgi:hypothetical protein